MHSSRNLESNTPNSEKNYDQILWSLNLMPSLRIQVLSSFSIANRRFAYLTLTITANQLEAGDLHYQQVWDLVVLIKPEECGLQTDYGYFDYGVTNDFRAGFECLADYLMTL
jgi:hypothetical protein